MTRRRGFRYWIEVLELTAIGALTRVLDFALLSPRPPLAWAYLRTLGAHLLSSPYRWPRAFEEVRVRKAAEVDERELVYGETPVFTAWWILRRAGLARAGRFVDLSAGRGRPLLGARLFTERVEGVELLESRVRPTEKALSAVGATLRVGDGTREDLSDASVAMVTWTGFGPQLKARFEAAARTLPKGAHFVALDCPVEGPGFEEVDRLEVLCTWGVVPVWIYRRVDSAPPTALWR